MMRIYHVSHFLKVQNLIDILCENGNNLNCLDNKLITKLVSFLESKKQLLRYNSFFLALL